MRPSTVTLDELLLTAEEVSELFGGIPKKTILQYARDGRLPCLRIGKHVRFVRSELDRVLDAQRQPRPSAGRFHPAATSLPVSASRRLEAPRWPSHDTSRDRAGTKLNCFVATTL